MLLNTKCGTYLKESYTCGTAGPEEGNGQKSLVKTNVVGLTPEHASRLK